LIKSAAQVWLLVYSSGVTMAKAEKNPRFSRVSMILQKLGIMEEDRVQEETETKRTKEDEERKKKEEEERLKKEAEEKRRRDEEEARLAKEKAARESRELKERERKAARANLEKQLDMEEQVAEEQMTADHQKEMKRIKRSKVPKWAVFAALAAFVIGAVAAGVWWYRTWTQAEKEKREREAFIAKAEKTASDQAAEIKLLEGKLQALQSKVGLSTDELVQVDELKAEIDRLKKLQEKALKAAEKAKAAKKKDKQKLELGLDDFEKPI
jgi:hypothetical protein